MQKILCLFSILVTISTIMLHGQIQGTATLFSPGQLQYNSALERESFAGFFRGNPDYLAMIAAVNPGTDARELELYRDWVDEIIENIRTPKFESLGEVKKINRIRSYVSEALLITHSNQAGFDDLFQSGTYNYLTAAAMYAFIMEELKIPYEIHETPTHIYLLAYPDDLRIEIMAGRPTSLYFMFEHGVRESFVEYFHETDVIDDFTFSNTSNRDLFEQFYFASYGLGLRDMVGLLYLNSAVAQLVQNQPYDAYGQLEKAFILHPSYKSQYLLLSQLGGFLRNLDYHNTRDLGFLVKASGLIGFGVKAEMVIGYFADIISSVLAEEKDRNAFENIRDYIHQYINDTALTREFEFLSLYEYGKLDYEDERYEEALESLEAAFRIYPENEDNQNLLVMALAGYATTVGPEVVLEKIQEYDTAFTEIESEDVYTYVRINTYLELFGRFFQLQDRENGEKYMALFEFLSGRHPGTPTDHVIIGRSYSSAAIYYYRRGMVNRSKEIVQKGLVYAPQNIELLLKLSAFE